MIELLLQKIPPDVLLPVNQSNFENLKYAWSMDFFTIFNTCMIIRTHCLAVSFFHIIIMYKEDSSGSDTWML